MSALVAVALLVAGLVLMNVGAEVMRTQGERTAITEEQYRGARVGAVTRRELEQRFGPSVSMPTAVSKTCDYYLEHGRHAMIFKFCFDASGTLISKGRASN